MPQDQLALTGTVRHAGPEAVAVAQNLHLGHGLDREPEALSGLQARGADDLDLHLALAPASDAIDGIAAQAGLAPQLADDERHAPGNDIPAALVTECEVSLGIDPLHTPRPDMRAMVLVRIFGEPIAMLSLIVPAGGLPAPELAAAIVAECEPALRDRMQDAGLPWTGELSVDGLTPARTPRFVAGRERALREGPEITVAVCTRDRTADLARLLESLREQEYPRLKVLVVDNAPSDDGTARLVARWAQTMAIDYVVEPRPGLSWARNRAIEASTSEVIAWADDDEVCEAGWATELARAFVEVPEAGAVTGIVAPAELVTESQLWFERYSGVRRGRGFERAVFSPATARIQSPLYPLPPYGAGANMAFRRSAIERIGRFDTALGTGTATLAGEDTAALCALLLDGGTVVWQPSAVVHHRHRRDRRSLEKVMLGYGRGLSAYYASMVIRRPSCLLELVRLSRRALRDQLSAGGLKAAELDGFPPELLAINRKGLLQGALFYPGARRRARRVAGVAAGADRR